ncbi:MAG: hypothetical protein DME62_00540 [Verrucomicrobia bacterium]|nr:MAG: hypothetical protein DME62_00540 [Verrucomicrobiota bacterium]
MNTLRYGDETRLHSPHSQRITSADEICLSHSCTRRLKNRRICAGATYSAAPSLSRRSAELRRGDGDTIANFFGQQRFRAGQDRWQNGRIFPEGAHLIQARARHAQDRRSRSVDARSSSGDLHDLHNQGRRPEIRRRCTEQSCRASEIEMAALHKLNPGRNWEHLQPSDVLKVPNVLPFEVERFTEGKVPENPAFGSRKIFIDTYEHLLEVFDQDQLVCVFPITPGSKTLPAPVGTWKILAATIWPWFRYDEGMLNYGVRTENYYNLPPGPNNLVGILWMGLNKPGIGIHGTNNPETIGRAASHGCIRLANWDAARVKDLVSVGNTVLIF